jgi:hypothetical protein
MLQALMIRTPRLGNFDLENVIAPSFELQRMLVHEVLSKQWLFSGRCFGTRMKTKDIKIGT